MRPHALLIAAAFVTGAAGIVCDPYGEKGAADEGTVVDGGADVVGAANQDGSLADAGGDAALEAPVEIAAVSPSAMAASAVALVWVDGNSVFARVGNAPPALLMSTPLATGFVAIQSVTAVMSESTGVRRCGIDSPCGSDPSAPIFGFADVGPIAVSAGEMFVAERGGSRRLMTCGLTQNCGMNPASLAMLPAVANRMALGSAYVVLGLDDKSLVAYPRAARLDAGATAPVLLGSVFDLRGLTVDGTSAYWTDGAGGTVSRCVIDACASTTTTVLADRSFPRAIAVDGGKAYWVETDGDSVWKCSLPACSDAARVARIARPVDLAIGDRLYVASAGTQKIYAVPR